MQLSARGWACGCTPYRGVHTRTPAVMPGVRSVQKSVRTPAHPLKSVVCKTSRRIGVRGNFGVRVGVRKNSRPHTGFPQINEGGAV